MSNRQRRRRSLAFAVPAIAIVATGSMSALAAPALAGAAPTATLADGTVTVTGTAGRDLIGIAESETRVAVDFGLDGTADVSFSRAGVQRVLVQAAGGDDGVALTGAGALPTTLSGGAGNDGMGAVGDIGSSGAGDAAITIVGNDGNDNLLAATPGPITVRAGAGNDLLDAGGAGVGKETLLLGDGDDVLRSSLNAFVGTRSDVVDGGLGQDTVQMTASFADDSASLSANAGHLLVTDGRGTVDADNVEDVKWIGLGGLDGGDSVVVNDLTGTDVVRFTPDFSSGEDDKAPNNSPDQLTVRGTNGDDVIHVSGSGADVTVSGLTPTVTPVFLDSEDVLRIETLGGRDVVDSSALQRGLVQLEVI
jgi:hypothetical protein